MENIIYVAAPRDWFDYISSILTFAFSLVAIIIAVSTARRQNRIALFEKRHVVYTCLLKIKIYSERIAAIRLKNKEITIQGLLAEWVLIQKSTFCLPEEISFVPLNKQTLYSLAANQNDSELRIQDLKSIRNQQAKDSFILFQSESLFGKRIGKLIDTLDEAYNKYIDCLLLQYFNLCEPNEDRVKLSEDTFIQTSKRILRQLMKSNRIKKKIHLS